MDLLDDLRPERHAPAAHGLGIGRLAGADAGEGAVDEIGADFALQHRIAPVAHVLENQQAQHDLGRRAEPTPAAALGMAFGQGFVDGCDDLLVTEHLIAVSHPVFLQIFDLGRDQAVAKTELRSPHLNHAASSRTPLHPDAAARD